MYLSRKKLEKMGFAWLGQNVLISDKATIINPQDISIKSNVRIDDFCILSGEIEIGHYVHIGAYSALIGRGLIKLDNFAGVSIRCILLSSSDDYSGEWMTNPLIPDKFLHTHHAPIIMNKHALLGAGSIVLPGVAFGEGAVAGANSLVKDSVPEFEIWGGTPARFLKARKRDVLKMEKQLWHG